MKPQSTTKKVLRTAAIGAMFISLAAWITPRTYYQDQMDNELIQTIKDKLSDYTTTLPEDRVYLHFDKPFYEPGESIWFSAYVREGANLKPSTKSDIVHVELINPKGSVEKRINIVAKNGKAAGDFMLDEGILGGLYKVRAYTNWMKNDGENNAFEKDLQIQTVVLPNLKMKLEFEKKAFGAGDEVIAKLELNTNENKALINQEIKFVAELAGVKLITKTESTDEEGIKYIKFVLPKDLKTNDGLLNVMIDFNGNTESVSRSIPIVLNKIDFKLFPEGGDLVAGLESHVAFRALNEFGKPADIEGVVVTEKGSQVASFSSFHQGMGDFKFTPQPNESYKVKITKPAGITETYSVPEALSAGYILNIDNSIAGEINSNILTTENEELSLIAQVRGKVVYTTVVNSQKGNNRVIFPTTNFPIGVAQITLFDSKGIARAERMVFVNKNKQLNISIETDKEKYLPREKVKMTVNVKDERGLQMPAFLSVAVVNDQLLSFANDKSGNMLSQLLLQQDLTDKVEEPAFYFDNKEKKSDKALDYLLMTSGWRRFTWEKVMNEEAPQITYLGEKAIVAGSILDAYTGKPIFNVEVKATNGVAHSSDLNGKYSFKRLDLSSPVTLTYKVDGYSLQSQYVYDYNQNLTVYLYPINYSYNYPTSSSRSGKGNVVMENEGLAMDNDMPGVALGAGMKEIMQKPVERLKNAPQKEGKRKEAAFLPLAANKKGDKKLEEADQKAVPKDIVEAKSEKQVMSKVADDRADKFGSLSGEMDEERNVQQINRQTYYRARKFAAPIYAKEENVTTRTDFRNTIYWNPNVEVGYSGKKTIEFYASDDITSFRTTVEGLSTDGSIGRTEKNFFSQLPFGMFTKIPVEVATEDLVSIPLTLKNNTNGPLGGSLTIIAPDGLREMVKIPNVQTIMPGAAKTIYLDYKVLDKIGEGEFTISFKACGLGDAFTQKIKIAPKGFPTTSSFSGQDVEKEYSFFTQHVVKGSLKMKFTAFPNVVSDLMKGVEGILREPGGCFEQTSMSAYPNAMVLDYLKSTDSKDDKTISYATNLLDRGYKRLVTFETKDKGYEWFGASPAHEGLTAYGLMEFNDMKKAGGQVDQQMIDRTAKWVMSQKDGKGGFKRNTNAYHDFGSISEDIMNGYIVYALAEAGYSDIKTEFNASYAKAISTKDPYLMAMMANAAYKMNETKKAEDMMDLLMKKQDKNGSWNGTTHSITYSQGQSLIIETTSIGIMAILKSQGKYTGELTSAVQYLTSSRSGYGVFGSTQGTVMALKALTEYAKASKKTTEGGKIIVSVDGVDVAEKTYVAGQKDAIMVEGLEQFVKTEGQHNVKVKYVGVKNPLPYSVAVSWNTSLPNSNKECVVDMTTKFASKSANVGETLRLTTIVTNKKKESIPSTMAIIGIPAGFTVQPWQLKELQEKKVFDYYEILGNNIAIYYRGMGPSAVKEINLDLKAEMPGEYDAPASSAYLYYTNEFKTWAGADKLIIKKATSI